MIVAAGGGEVSVGDWPSNWGEGVEEATTETLVGFLVDIVVVGEVDGEGWERPLPSMSGEATGVGIA